jgi:ribonuclease HII
VSGRLGKPTLEYERQLWARGYRCVAGLDEAGRGAWAGPVVAAAVILPPGDERLRIELAGVRDSKRLTAGQRQHWAVAIEAQAIAWGLGTVPAAEIDTLGIVPATRKAMAQALQALLPAADYLLIDYLPLPDLPLPQQCLVRGDAGVLSIAAASILAKVGRDRLMIGLEASFPGYGFARHKGYGTAEHRAALARLGPCTLHRRSFAPLRGWGEGGSASAAAAYEPATCAKPQDVIDSEAVKSNEM